MGAPLFFSKFKTEKQCPFYRCKITPTPFYSVIENFHSDPKYSFHMTRKSRIYQTLAAISALIVGLSIYLFDRQPETVYFISNRFSFDGDTKPIFGIIGNYLPAFLHVYAFILLTAVVFAQSHRHILIICVGWLAVDSLFEIGQINLIAEAITVHIPGWFAGIPFLENTANYFLLGTFDTLDLLSIAAGTLAAYLIIILSKGVPAKKETGLF